MLWESPFYRWWGWGASVQVPLWPFIMILMIVVHLIVGIFYTENSEYRSSITKIKQNNRFVIWKVFLKSHFSVIVRKIQKYLSHTDSAIECIFWEQLPYHWEPVMLICVKLTIWLHFPGDFVHIILWSSISYDHDDPWDAFSGTWLRIKQGISDILNCFSWNRGRKQFNFIFVLLGREG